MRNGTPIYTTINNVFLLLVAVCMLLPDVPVDGKVAMLVLFLQWHALSKFRPLIPLRYYSCLANCAKGKSFFVFSGGKRNQDLITPTLRTVKSAE